MVEAIVLMSTLLFIASVGYIIHGEQKNIRRFINKNLWKR